MIFRFAALATALGLAATLATAPAARADSAGACAPEWAPFGGAGANATVRAMIRYEVASGAGVGDQLYVGGEFTTIDGVAVNGIARWDGASWQSVGGGVSGTGFQVGVHALAVFNDGSGSALYAAGRFQVAGATPADGIARWDGHSWTAVGTGTITPAGSVINALVVHDDGTGPALYAAGSFTGIGGVAASRIAKWNGTQWTPLGAGLGSSGYCLASMGSGASARLIVGGIFVNAGGAPAVEIAQWDGAGWAPMGAGLGGLGVYSLAIYDEGHGAGPQLFAGGEFTGSGSPGYARIARWNGTAWSGLSASGGGASSGVYSMGVFDDGTGAGPALYAGGFFTTISGVPASCIARWDGTAWSALGAGTVGGGVFELFGIPSVSGAPATLLVGGNFNTAGGAPASGLAQWQGCVAPSCAPADLNCDGAVNGADLGLLLAAWGTCSGCGADINGDGTVDGADLGLLLAAWTG